MACQNGHRGCDIYRASNPSTRWAGCSSYEKENFFERISLASTQLRITYCHSQEPPEIQRIKIGFSRPVVFNILLYPVYFSFNVLMWERLFITYLSGKGAEGRAQLEPLFRENLQPLKAIEIQNKTKKKHTGEILWYFCLWFSHQYGFPFLSPISSYRPRLAQIE